MPKIKCNPDSDKLQVIIPVRQSEVRIHRTDYTVISITDATSPNAFSLEEIEEIILMDRIISDQRDIMPLPDTLTQV